MTGNEVLPDRAGHRPERWGSRSGHAAMRVQHAPYRIFWAFELGGPRNHGKRP